MSNKKNTPEKRTQGMNWIAQSTRLAIYLRDGLACAYCSRGIEDGATLTLDHIKPYSKGGNNKPANLVTCCRHCNSARGNRPMRTFVKAVSEYVDSDSKDIVKFINNTRKKNLPRAEAREMVQRRGSCAKALKNM